VIDFDFGVVLGALNSTHADKIREWRNDPRIMRWCRQKDLISDIEQVRWFEAQDVDPKIKMYSVFKGSDLIGVCGFTSIDMLARHAEFSLYIAPSFQRKGYGTKALRTLFKHGFNSLGLEQIWGEVLEGNPAINTFQGLGMKVDGKRRSVYFKEGKLWDSTLVSILRDEWKMH